MDLVRDEEQTILVRAVRDVAAQRSPLRRVHALVNGEDSPFQRELWREMARLGWLGLCLPEVHGGAGLPLRYALVVAHELGRGLVPEPYVPAIVLGAGLVLRAGSRSQHAEHLAAVAAGERLLAVAHAERRGRFALDTPATVAERADGGWVLRGEKSHVLGGGAADWLVVSARAGAGVGLFLVPTAAPGVAVERTHRLDGRDAALVRLEGVRVGADAGLGDPEGGLAPLARTVDEATIALCAEMQGGTDAVFQMTLEYLKTRRQFGVPIGSFQALQHRAARLFAEVELARAAVEAAAEVLEGQPDDRAVARAASIAKAKCTDAFLLASLEGIQLHGGIGMTDEHDVGLFLKRARVAEMTWGDAVHHRDRFAALGGF